MKKILLPVLLVIIVTHGLNAQPFIHPGINQSSKDLAYLKQQVIKGAQPWKGAFDRLKDTVDNSSFIIKAYTHVLRGPYGKPNIGGDDLSKGANMAYNCAMLWYITGDKTYANKAIAILNAWSPILWDFDYNDAKLLAAWTGHLLCNAAELLRYSNADWKQEDIESFSHMLMTVYYPLIRYYFPQANGNWDGAIIHTIMAMAIFLDNRNMFKNATDHFLHGTFNGALLKYIYPSGQCQESTRDQAHVQLGLGEFAGAAQVAYTQGVDLLSVGDNRIALGFEYTAGFLLGTRPHSYGTISERAKTLRDDYEYVYNHYSAKGLNLPNVKKVADSVRPTAGRSVLSATRAPVAMTGNKSTDLSVPAFAGVTGAGSAVLSLPELNVVYVSPGESIQKALDAASGTGKWVVAKAGVHILPGTINMPSSVTLAGEGLATALFLDPASGARDAIVNADTNMHDVTIRSLVIEGASKPDPGADPNSSRSYRNNANRGGIIFRANSPGGMRRLNFINITIQNCTFNGLLVSGASEVTISRCNFDENGSSVIPGPKLQHNLLLSHCSAVTINNSRADTSPCGCGIAIDHCSGITISQTEIARNAYYGILIAETKNVTVEDNLVEANDRSGIMVEYLDWGTKRITIHNNRVQYNGGYGVEAVASKNIKVAGNSYAGNGSNKSQEKITDEKRIIME